MLVVRAPQPWCPRPLGEWLLRRLLEQSKYFAQYLPIVPLFAVQGSTGTVLLQHYREDSTPLRCISAAQLADPKVVQALCHFWRAVESGWRAAGRLPDIGGRVYTPWELYSPLRTANVVVDTRGNCWLVDVGADTIFHNMQSPLGRLHGFLMLRAIRRARRRLGCAGEGPRL